MCRTSCSARPSPGRRPGLRISTFPCWLSWWGGEALWNKIFSCQAPPRTNNKYLLPHRWLFRRVRPRVFRPVIWRDNLKIRKIRKIRNIWAALAIHSREYWELRVLRKTEMKKGSMPNRSIIFKKLVKKLNWKETIFSLTENAKQRLIYILDIKRFYWKVSIWGKIWYLRENGDSSPFDFISIW